MLKDILTPRLVTVDPNDKVSKAAEVMEQEDVGCVLVLDNGRPRGVLTDRDIVIRCIAKNIDVDDCTVENIMSEALEVVRDGDGIFECIETMRKAGVRRLPVVNERGEAVGIVSFGDILAVLSKEFYELTSMTTPAAEQEGRMAA